VAGKLRGKWEPSPVSERPDGSRLIAPTTRASRESSVFASLASVAVVIAAEAEIDGCRGRSD